MGCFAIGKNGNADKKMGSMSSVGCNSLNHAHLLDLELFLYLRYFTMILGTINP